MADVSDNGVVDNLAPLRWPVTPVSGESLIGYIARSAAENFMGTTKCILKGSGINIPHSGYVGSKVSSKQLRRLSEVLSVSQSDLTRMAWLEINTDSSGSLVQWGDRTMRVRDLEPRFRMIAPSALLQYQFHRAIWMVRFLPYCPETFEKLISRCPECNRPFRWKAGWGLARCDSGLHSIISTGDFLRADLQKNYGQFARLLSGDPDVARDARSNIDRDIASLSNPALADLVFSLGRIDRPAGALMRAYHTSANDELTTAKQIHRGIEFILNWPTLMQDLADKALRHRVNSRYKHGRLKGLVSQAKGSELETVLSKAMPQLSKDRRVAIEKNGAPIMLGDELKRLAGLNAKDIVRLGDAGLLDANITNKGKRTHVQFDRAGAIALANAKRHSLPINSVSEAIGLPLYAIHQIIDAGMLAPVRQAGIEIICEDRRIWNDSLDTLLKELNDAALLPFDHTNQTSIHSAAQFFGGGPKPWASIFRHLLSSGTSFALADRKKQFTTRAAFIPNDKLDHFRQAGAIQNEESFLPATISKRDIEDILNIPYKMVAVLERSELLTFTKEVRAHSTIFSEVLAIASKRIFSCEASLKLGATYPQTRRVLSNHGLQQLKHGGWDRGKFEFFLKEHCKLV